MLFVLGLVGWYLSDPFSVFVVCVLPSWYLVFCSIVFGFHPFFWLFVLF